MDQVVTPPSLESDADGFTRREFLSDRPGAHLRGSLIEDCGLGRKGSQHLQAQRMYRISGGCRGAQSGSDFYAETVTDFRGYFFAM